MANKKIYLAGKIHKGDWRESLVSNIDWPKFDYSMVSALKAKGADGFADRWGIDFFDGQGLSLGAACGSGAADGPAMWPILERAVLATFDYVGPYFVSCDHGCFHGNNTHGNIDVSGFWGEYDYEKYGDSEGVTIIEDDTQPVEATAFKASFNQMIVTVLCREAIKECDIVFAWIDALDAYGTITELGYAAALGKEILIAGPKQYSDMWFVYTLAGNFKLADSPLAALQEYIAEKNYLPSPAFDSPIEEMFWNAWQRAGGRTAVELEYQYTIPGTNYRVDFANVEEKVAIELDGYEYHNGKEQFTRDRQRQREIEKTGWRFVRFSGSEVYKDAGRCFAESSAFIIDLWRQRTAAAGRK